MSQFNFKQFDKAGARLTKTPELTVQSKGTMGLNAAAYALMGEPEAIEFLFDPEANVIGLRPVAADDNHAYPIRTVGGKNSKAKTYLVAGTAFLNFYGIPFTEPRRRVVTLDDGVLIVDLNDPGRSAISNRNRAKVAAAARNSEEAVTGPRDSDPGSSGSDS